MTDVVDISGRVSGKVVPLNESVGLQHALIDRLLEMAALIRKSDLAAMALVGIAKSGDTYTDLLVPQNDRDLAGRLVGELSLVLTDAEENLRAERLRQNICMPIKE